jgi:hypothetical protein
MKDGHAFKTYFDIEPSNYNYLPFKIKSVYIETGGTIAYLHQSGKVKIIEVGNDSTLEVRTHKIFKSNTTAKGLIGRIEQEDFDLVASKPFIESKTIWTAATVAIAGFIPEVQELIASNPMESIELAAGLLVGNRLLTKKSIA